MIPSAYTLRDFYKTLGGRIVRRLIRERILEIWPEVKGMGLLGGGYAVPYLKAYRDGAERVLAVMHPPLGVHHWPDDGANLACLAEQNDLPFEANSIDRIVLVHSLEFTSFVKPALEELWRVLKSNGRIIVVVPNRIGLWARADWTPFGRGAPYTSGQVEHFLRESLFIPERTERALFVPPFKSQMLLRSAGLWEGVGRRICPAMGGVVIVEASKQIYAGIAKPVRAVEKMQIKRPVAMPEPV
jgi:SAM-dependent methyltransferase